MENEIKAGDTGKGSGKKPYKKKWKKKPYNQNKKFTTKTPILGKGINSAVNSDLNRSSSSKAEKDLMDKEGFHGKTDPYMWSTISRFQLDDSGSSFKFSDRAARENGWTKEYTLRTIEEYKKFIYLCVVGDMCTPSDEVDQIWHMHMTYTESYKDMCNAVGRFIKHGPTKGGRQESLKYNEVYTRTLINYKVEFGEDAPADIWPDVTSRFENYNNYQRVNMDTNWVIPKPKLKFWPFAAFCPFILMSGAGTVVLLILCGIGSVLLIKALIGWAVRSGEKESQINNSSSYTHYTDPRKRKKSSGCSSSNNIVGCSSSGCSSDNSSSGGFDGGDSGGAGSSGDSGCSSGDSGCSSGCSGCGGD